MTFGLNQAGYDLWKQQRAYLWPNEILILDAATEDLIFRNAATWPAEHTTIKPPETLTQWLDQRSKLTKEQQNALDEVAQTIVSSKIAAKPPAPAPTAPEIPRPIETPTYWKETKTAAISLSAAGTQTIIPQRPGYSYFIITIVFTVSDETDITFTFGRFGDSGALTLGGSDEPRAMIITMADSPAPCGPGPLKITSDGPTTEVGGFVVYSEEEEQRTV